MFCLLRLIHRTEKLPLLLESASSIIITSDYAAEEARRNISAKRPSAMKELEKIVNRIEIVPSIQSESCPIDLPAKDQPIFLSALLAKATHLLTGDLKDFGPHMNQPKKSAGIVIQTVSDFLNSI